MAEHGYDKGRLNLPFVGHCTFAKQPAVLDWDSLDADVCVLGAPFDMGTQYRAGARLGHAQFAKRRRCFHSVTPACMTLKTTSHICRTMA
jgi:arginase family enzyme